MTLHRWSIHLNIRGDSAAANSLIPGIAFSLRHGAFAIISQSRAMLSPPGRLTSRLMDDLMNPGSRKIFLDACVLSIHSS
jgi:hypothetical protein